MAGVGYAALYQDYSHNNFDLKTTTQGPTFSLALHF